MQKAFTNLFLNLLLFLFLYIEFVIVKLFTNFSKNVYGSFHIYKTCKLEGNNRKQTFLNVSFKANYPLN